MQCVNACPVFKFLCPLNSTLCTTSNMPFYFSQEYRSKIELIKPGSSFPVDPMYIYFCPTNLTCFLYSQWAITNGIRGENCATSTHATDNVCEDVIQPQCVDRTIRCNPLPGGFGNEEITVVASPNTDDLTEFGTIIQWACPDKFHYFNYSIPADLISFHYSTNINETAFTCNQDG